ncbi:MAG TPA: choice-of-anchor D domain-containing protein, partial [Verrucomicrobiae bacterium]|nr:choice-of-anchor D domain-containing protein [Verrucomicrobiae bacterium]
ISFPKALSAGQSVSFYVEFAPTTAGSVRGSLELLSNATDRTLTVGFNGAGVGVATAAGYATVTPLSAPFGNVPVGTKDSEVITVKNTGSSTLQVDSVTTSAKGFSISGITTPLSLAAGAETHFTVAFLPEASGSVTGSVVVKSNGSDSSVAVAVSGAGEVSSRELSVSPTSVAFGSVDTGSSATKQISLKNTGNSNLAISSESITGTGLTEAGMGGAVTLTPGQSATLTVEFAPKAVGAVSGGVTIASNASNGTSITVPVTGTGVSTSTPPPSSKVVALSWKASTSSGIVGYDVFRGTTSGGPYTKLVSSPVAGTSYSDSTVTAGDEYYYVVAAVSSNGTESSYSNEAVVSVP